MARPRDIRSSCNRRGTRIAQPLSRKCRLISPTIVGVAYVENSSPRSGSNLSTALMRPIVPTCTRSSSGSPRSRNRRARYCTSGRCSVDELVAGTSARGIVGRRGSEHLDELALAASLLGAPPGRALLRDDVAVAPGASSSTAGGVTPGAGPPPCWGTARASRSRSPSVMPRPLSASSGRCAARP